ncbi:hypothetical protein BKA82DRAFT_4340581, partial [Pisolithus tinctorius]
MDSIITKTTGHLGMPPSWQLLRFCGPFGSASRGNLLLHDDDDEDAASTQQQTRTGNATTTTLLRAGAVHLGTGSAATAATNATPAIPHHGATNSETDNLVRRVDIRGYIRRRSQQTARGMWSNEGVQTSHHSSQQTTGLRIRRIRRPRLGNKVHQS